MTHMECDEGSLVDDCPVGGSLHGFHVSLGEGKDYSALEHRACEGTTQNLGCLRHYS